MASVIVAPKQIATNNAYFITVAPLTGTVAGRTLFVNNGTVDAPEFSTSPLSVAGAASTTLATAGAILRDMGVNVFSSGSVFRKVQLLRYSAAADTALTGGVAGDAEDVDTGYPYLTSYIVLPGLQGASAPTTANVDGNAVVPTAVARLG